MKYTIVLAALAACIAAQDPSIIPECARDCLLKATASATTCKDGDYSCTCKPENKAAIQSAATSCVIAACGVDKALSTSSPSLPRLASVSEVVPASDKLCSAAAAGPATSAAATSAAASAASSAASAASSLASAASSAASAASSAASAASSAASAATTAKPSASATKPAGNGTAPAPTTSAVQAGAAGLAPIGGLAMLALGALAL
ncbi:CFEM domain-containing protein [Colletotrichum musicola]|uniref:CFEM domain-containing protein n=1 Tax=Colletotrichum musicola TaxID=2175873 RepID=A0A8H6K5E2_9PEZI|nr:CFEM domain-containing protein [Colletotrichum musicola]